MSTTTTDPVLKPTHYNRDGATETLLAIEEMADNLDDEYSMEASKIFNLGQAFKYVDRLFAKGNTDDAKRDAGKARFYFRRFIGGAHDIKPD